MKGCLFIVFLFFCLFASIGLIVYAADKRECHTHGGIYVQTTHGYECRKGLP